MRLRSQLKLLIIGLVLCLGFLPGKALAAGSVSVTVEASPNPVTAGNQVELRFYATGSGANLYGVSVRVALSNLTYDKFDDDNTSFNGFAGVPSGGSVGSTSFEIAASYAAPSTGAPSGVKAYIGLVVVNTVAAGSANVDLSGALAADNTNDPMSASVTDRSVTVNAPPAGTPTCPTGQTGTPPNCITPTPGGSSPSAPANLITNPNPKSSVAVPNTANNPDDPPNTIPENELATIFNQVDADTAGEAPKLFDLKSPWLKTLIWAGPVLLVAGATSLFWLTRRRRLIGFSSHTPLGPTHASPKPTTPTPPPPIEPNKIIRPDVASQNNGSSVDDPSQK